LIVGAQSAGRKILMDGIRSRSGLVMAYCLCVHLQHGTAPKPQADRSVPIPPRADAFNSQSM
jgi:hypothetical protein